MPPLGLPTRPALIAENKRFDGRLLVVKVSGCQISELFRATGVALIFETPYEPTILVALCVHN